MGHQVTDGAGRTTFTGDPDGLAPALQTLYAGLGTDGETWSGILTQYCDGAAVGATTCTQGDAMVPHPVGGVLAGIWYDNSAAATAQETAGLTGHQLAAEAEAAATHFGNTDQASNRDTQYVIVSPTGTDPDGWADPADRLLRLPRRHPRPLDRRRRAGVGPIVAFTNLPYVPDAGPTAAPGSVNSPGHPRRRHRGGQPRVRRDGDRPVPRDEPAGPGWIERRRAPRPVTCAPTSRPRPSVPRST